MILNKASVCIRPGRKRSKYEAYREAWHLMRVDVEPAQTSTECCGSRATGPVSSTRAVAADNVGSVGEASGAPDAAAVKASAKAAT